MLLLLLHNHLPDDLLSTAVGLEDLVDNMLLLLLLFRLLVYEEYLALLSWLVCQYSLGLLHYDGLLGLLNTPPTAAGRIQVELAGRRLKYLLSTTTMGSDQQCLT